MIGLVLVVGLVFGLWKRKSNLEIEKLKSENSKLITEKSALSEEVSLLTTQINQRDKEVGDLRPKAQALDRLRGELGELKRENDRLTTEKSALSEEVSLLTTQINQRDKEVADLRPKAQALDRLKEELGELKGAKEEYMAKLEEAEKYRLQLDKLNQANRESQEQINTLLEKINKGKAHTQQLATERIQLTDQLKQIKSGAEELAEAKNRAERTIQIQNQLVQSLKKEIAAGLVKITQLSGLTMIRIKEKILFDSGHASIKASGLNVLKKIGKTLEKIRDRHIQVEGHTDTRPLRWELSEKYPTNWELSTARATTIVRYLIDEVGIEATRLSAAGYAFYRPIASNDTPEGRQENRRVEFALVPIMGQQGESGLHK
jgi:chemotaxis protein MotB